MNYMSNDKKTGGKNFLFLTLIIYFWIRVVGTSSRKQNKNEISINLFPVCYQSLSIIFWREELDIQLGE